MGRGNSCAPISINTPGEPDVSKSPRGVIPFLFYFAPVACAAYGGGLADLDPDKQLSFFMLKKEFFMLCSSIDEQSEQRILVAW